MRILVDIGHPGHVHFYKHAIWRLQERGHEVLVSARQKDVTLDLLNYYSIPYHTLSTLGHGIRDLAWEFLQREWALLRLIWKFKPDVVTEITGDFIAPVCWLLRKPSIVFTDSEPVPTSKYLTYPFASVMCTPDCFLRDLGKRHVRYASYHELAYLHPNYFEPDPSVLDELGLSIDEPFSVLRFVAWKAGHDIGQQGFTPQFKQKVVQELSRYGRVFITSETPLSEELEPYRVSVPPHRIHHVLNYAQLFLGDGATMATEAGLLGTPSVRASSLALTMGNFVELMDRYQLVYSYYSPTEALEKAVSLLEQGDAKAEWAQRRERVLSEKVDMTAWMVDFIETYQR